MMINAFSFAQLTGTKNIPGDYASVGAAVAALNSAGVGPGGVTFSIADGSVFNESPLTITATGTSTAPIVFQQSGTGTKPIINFTGTILLSDAAFQLSSASYITFTGLDIRDASSQMEYGFYFTGTPTSGSQNNLVSNCVITLNASNSNSAGIYWVSAATSAAGAMSGNRFYNNTVQNCNTGYSLTGVSTGSYDTGNEIGISGSGVSLITNLGGNAVNAYGIFFDYQKSFKIFNTTISNGTTSTNTKQAYGIYCPGNGYNTYNVYNNIITGFTGPGQNVGSSIYGSGSTGSFYNNVIHGISSSMQNVYGMSCTGNVTIYNNTIYDISGLAASGQVWGINNGIGTFTVYNNLVYDCRNPNFNTPGNLGVMCYMAHGSNIVANLYNNTFFLDYVSTSANNQSACVYWTSIPSMVTMKNNILVNRCDMSTGLRSVAFALQSPGLANYSTLSNNNCFYAGSPGTKNLLYYDGVNSIQNIEAFRAIVDPHENQSFSENPPFISAVAPYNFHIQATVPSQCESAGLTITSPVSITTDHDGVPRFPNAGYPNSASFQAIAPDLGAFEFGGLSVDKTPPNIQYTPLANAGSTAPRTLIATITDMKSGMPVSGIGLPVLYWHSSLIPWTSVAGVSLGAGQYSFTFGGGVANPDVIFYYIAAQDNATIPNVIAKPLTGTSSFTANPPASLTPPSSPNFYAILPPISGNVTVGGTGATYPTLTGAGGFFTDINNKVVTGNLTITITGDLLEPGTYQLNQVIYDNLNPYSIKIVPGGATERLITNSADVPMIVFNGADQIVIDGRFNGSGRYLRFRSTSTQNSSLVLQNDAMYDTIRNCIFETSCAGTSGAVLISTTTGTQGNSYNVFMNNLFRDRTDVVGYALYNVSSMGTAGSLNSNNVFDGNEFINFKTSGIFVGGVGNGNNWQITNNSFYMTAGITTMGHMYPIYFNGSTTSSGNIISGNYIGGTAPQCGGSPFVDPAVNYGIYGIYAFAGTGIPTEIQGNTIKNITMTGTGTGTGSSFYGIRASSGSFNIGTTVGNMVGDTAVSNSITMAGAGTTVGIYALGADNVSNNIVANITTSNPSALNLCNGIRLDGNFPLVCERNKIVNIGPATGAANPLTNNPLVGIYLNGAATMTNTYQVDNNLISLGGNGGVHNIEMDGILVFRNTGAYYIYDNSINITGMAEANNTRGSSGIWKTDAATVVCTDNIISNLRVSGSGGTGKHYSIAAVNTTNLTSNYNDLYSGAAATTCLYGATDCTFPTWKTLSAGDLNSVSVNPNFISNTDLHTIRAELHDAGIAIPGITTDYAGVTRGNPPDIGAYEFPLAPTVVTNPATNLTASSATLNGTVNANNLATTISFDYGLTTAYGTTVNAVPSTSAGVTSILVNAGLSGLPINTVYHFRVKAVNAIGTSYGADLTFSTACPLPVAAGPISGQTAVCQGSTGIVYTISPLTWATGYTWSLPTGATIISGNNTNAITVSYSANAVSGNVTVFGVSQCGTGASSTMPVTVNVTPVPTITGNPTACVNSTNNTFTTETGKTGYAWTVSAGGTITSGQGTSAIAVTWVSTGSQTVTVIYANPNGCTALAPALRTVAVSALPAPTISGSATVCTNTGFNTYFTEPGMGNYAWTISPGGIISSGQGTSTILVTWNTPGSQTLTVTYSNTSGCFAATPTGYNVTVNGSPANSGNITGTSIICGGAQGVAYTVAPIAGALAYVWTLPAGASIASGTNTNAITVNFASNASSGNITVAGNNLCGNGNPSPNFPITVNALPASAGTITGDASVCMGSSNHVYNVPQIANATNYTWMLPAGTTITSGQNSSTITVTFGPTAVAGNITVTGVNSCGNGATSPNFAVAVHPIPAAPVVTALGSLLTSSVATGNQWYYEGNAIAGATGQTYTVTHNTGYYSCAVTLSGCSSPVSNKLWVVVTGQEELQGSSVNVYPVPNDGMFTVSIGNPTPGNYTLIVLNNLGIIIKEIRGIAANGRFDQVIDLRPAASGVYTIVIRNGNSQVVKKMVISK